MPDQLKEMNEKIAAREQAQLETWRPYSKATHTTRELFKQYEEAAQQAKAAAQAVAQQVRQLQADDATRPEIVRQRVADALAEGRAAVQKQQKQMETALQALKTELSTAAMPRLDSARETPARDELRMILDGSADPVAALCDLAQRDDELGAVACTSYAESYLRAKGVPKAQEAAQMVRGVAADAAARSADPTRQAIGKAHNELGQLEQSRDCTEYITRTALGEVGG